MTTRNKHVQDKGKRNIEKSIEMEQSYKFKEDPLVEKVALEIDMKRGHHEKRIAQKKREKKTLEDIERMLQKVQQELREEQELRRREKEVQ